MKRILLPFLIFGGALGIAFILVQTPTTVEVAAVEVKAVNVRVAKVGMESVELAVESQGKVQAAQRVNLSAPVAGPVAWVSPALEVGSYIQKGQPLLRLEASDFETGVSRARSSLQQAQAESDHATNELNRMQGLAQQRLASDSQFQDATRMAAVSTARLADAQASFEQAKMDLERTEVKAPFNAIVEIKEVELGQYLNRAQNIAVLNGADVVEVRVPLAIRQLGYLDIPLDSRVELDAATAPDVLVTGHYGGQERQWQGKLVRTEASIDAISNTVQTIIRVQQPVTGTGKHGHEDSPAIPLPIGLYVQASIAGKTINDLIALPRKVIRNNNQVLVVDAENRMYFRDVEVFRLEENRVLISGGLLPGELICISPIQAVVDGMLVEPTVETI